MGHGTAEIKTRGKQWLDCDFSCQARFEFFDHTGTGLGPQDVDIFNPYDGYATMAQFFLETFQWHGVKRGYVHR